MSNNHTSKPRKTMLSYFGKKKDNQSSDGGGSSSPCNVRDRGSNFPSSSQRFEIENTDIPSDINTLYCERDLGLRLPIEVYPADKRDDVREAYIKMGPCQPMLDKYPPIPDGKQTHYFNILCSNDFRGLNIQ